MTLTTLLEQFTPISKIILGAFLLVLALIMLNFGFKMVELAHVMRSKRPFYVHFYWFKRRLSKQQKDILRQRFSFYKKLTIKEQRYFEHRVASFIKDKTFIGRQDQKIDNEVKVLISATAMMLTFGFRDFYIGLIDKIFVYPDAFYSHTNKDYHKGEFNPKLKALVLSWSDFKHGYDIGDDNLNLGIHEFAHAIHFNSIKEKDVSSIIFKDTFKELTDLLAKDKPLRDELVDSKYFREYAYTNQFEFLAVLIEYFMESPAVLKNKYPNIYVKVKQMLNFNYDGY